MSTDSPDPQPKVFSTRLSLSPVNSVSSNAPVPPVQQSRASTLVRAAASPVSRRGRRAGGIGRSHRRRAHRRSQSTASTSQRPSRRDQFQPKLARVKLHGHLDERLGLRDDHRFTGAPISRHGDRIDPDQLSLQLGSGQRRQTSVPILGGDTPVIEPGGGERPGHRLRCRRTRAGARRRRRGDRPDPVVPGGRIDRDDRAGTAAVQPGPVMVRSGEEPGRTHDTEHEQSEHERDAEPGPQDPECREPR